MSKISSQEVTFDGSLKNQEVSVMYSSALFQSDLIHLQRRKELQEWVLFADVHGMDMLRSVPGHRGKLIIKPFLSCKWKIRNDSKSCSIAILSRRGHNIARTQTNLLQPFFGMESFGRNIGWVACSYSFLCFRMFLFGQERAQFSFHFPNRISWVSLPVLATHSINAFNLFEETFV